MEERLGKECQGAAKVRKGTEGEEGGGKVEEGSKLQSEIISNIHIKWFNMF